jgi:hypothetical protein
MVFEWLVDVTNDAAIRGHNALAVTAVHEIDDLIHVSPRSVVALTVARLRHQETPAAYARPITLVNETEARMERYRVLDLHVHQSGQRAALAARLTEGRIEIRRLVQRCPTAIARDGGLSCCHALNDN